MIKPLPKLLHDAMSWLFAAVWLFNGLFCKLFNGVPRHRVIVSRILGEEYAGVWTKLIGMGEVLMAIWILSGIGVRLSAIAQIGLIVAMNSIEFCLAPDLLLFGRLNALVALMYVTVVYLHEFRMNPQSLRV